MTAVVQPSCDLQPCGALLPPSVASSHCFLCDQFIPRVGERSVLRSATGTSAKVCEISPFSSRFVTKWRSRSCIRNSNSLIFFSYSHGHIIVLHHRLQRLKHQRAVSPFRCDSPPRCLECGPTS